MSSAMHEAPVGQVWSGLRGFVPPVVTGDDLAALRVHLPITEAVRREIVPRLVLSERAERRRRRAPDVGALHPTEMEIERLGHLALAQDLTGARVLAEALCGRGVTVENIYLELLSAAARWMGGRWEDDRASFAEVSFGIVVLERIMRELAPALAGELPASPVGRSVLLAPEPGEQHIFGLMMVGEFFRASGWDVVMPSGRTAASIVAMAAREPFCVIVLSLACASRIDGLAALIRSIRRASRNPAIGIMVGGPAFNEHPDLVAAIGADATSADGRQAVRQAERLLALLPPRP